MSSFEYLWADRFAALFKKGVKLCEKGNWDYTTHYLPDELAFLESFGYQPREFFDFVEDHVSEGDPSLESAILTAAVRREYFLHVQKGVRSSHVLKPQDLPARDSELNGIVWLPRILAKAKAKLRGELDPEIMFGCGGDRRFLKRHNIHPAEFLNLVWRSGDDDQAVVQALQG